MKVDFHVVGKEHGSRQVGPSLRVVAMVMTNDNATSGRVLDCRQDIPTKTLGLTEW